MMQLFLKPMLGFAVNNCTVQFSSYIYNFTRETGLSAQTLVLTKVQACHGIGSCIRTQPRHASSKQFQCQHSQAQLHVQTQNGWCSDHLSICKPPHVLLLCTATHTDVSMGGLAHLLCLASEAAAIPAFAEAKTSMHLWLGEM